MVWIAKEGRKEKQRVKGVHDFTVSWFAYDLWLYEKLQGDTRMAKDTYKQELGLQDHRGKAILVGRLFSSCVIVGKSLNLSGLGFLVC